MGFDFGAHGVTTPNGGGGNADQIAQGWNGNQDIGTVYVGGSEYYTQGGYRWHVADKRVFAESMTLLWNCGDSSENPFTGTDTVWFTVFYYTQS